MKPIFHAQKSAKKFGGKPEDYFEIHEFFDISKSAIADNRHRALTHNAWFIYHILPRIFGDNIKNSDGDFVAVREIGEQHVLDDFKRFIPTAQDFLEEMEYRDWMHNGSGLPPSAKKLFRTKQKGTFTRWK